MNSSPALLTILDFLRWSISQMNEQVVCFGHGTDNSEDETMWLVSEGLHLPYPIPVEYWSARLTEEEKERLFHLLHRRIQDKVPLPYLIHKAWFAGLEFYVDERVLIPRSPIGELIASQFTPWIEPSRVRHILDVCTGSGCIAIACANAFPEAAVDALDISTDALLVARKNVQDLHCEENVTLWESNLFQTLPAPTEKYDIIVSNPPYVSQAEFSGLPPEYHHEPSIALLTQSNSPDGLEIVDEILAVAGQYLAPEGILVVEVGNSEEALIAKYPQLPFVWLDFERGGSGVFLLTAEQLKNYV